MPSSDAMTIPVVLKLISALNPSSILDVGAGNGKYGFLFREVLDMNYGRFARDDWNIKIDGIELVKEYKNPIHDYFYNIFVWEDWLKVDIDYDYDLIFMGDVLEHFEDGRWESALDKAKNNGNVVISVCPNWDGSIQQGAIFGHDSERHKTVLSPSRIGGKCVWANTKAFMTVHSQNDLIIGRDILI